MSDIKNLFRKLDDILHDMVKYSFTLGNWGRYTWIEIYIGYNGYGGKGFVVKPWKIYEFEHQKVCNSCFGDIYVSEYDRINRSYNIYTNDYISKVKENKKEIENIISNIETQAMYVYDITVDSYLDLLKNYSKVLIYFRRDIFDYNKIIEEIKNSIMFGQPINKVGPKDRLSYRFIALEEKEISKYGEESELSYPENYRFSFMIYEK
ncbi:hypothetical protein Nps_00820 [Candidatus Nanopusillus acidilobi]|nr:hypothetical protein Nps_00820 [Candidatus Nanopusillus acidilobi]